MKKITLCADDYALNEAVSDAILELIEAKRLSAVSCMVNYEYWPIYAEKLKYLSNKNIDIGLHFDLTQLLQSLGWSFNQLIINACLGRIDRDKITKALQDQLDSFEAMLARQPDFVDGHQHIHIFPFIRECFLRVLAQRYTKKLPYIRSSRPDIYGESFVKKIILRILGARFSQQASISGFSLPSQFLGVYSLRPGNFPTYFKHWLMQASDRSLIMCHPGHTSHDASDPVRQARVCEFNYFCSDDFLKDLQKNGISLEKWS